jgi:glutaryl-CoA dehydrogenase
MVGWASTGAQMGAFENALAYAQTRLQFGNLTACQCMMVRLATLDDTGKLTDQHAALAKAYCTSKARETMAWGREILGGNGIVADFNVGKFFCDIEALYSYEGTYQMQNLGSIYST